MEERILFNDWISAENLEGKLCVAGSRRHGKKNEMVKLSMNVENVKKGVLVF